VEPAINSLQSGLPPDGVHKLIKRVADHSDIRGAMFILKNRYLQEYRDRIVQEISGVKGLQLLPSINPFHVVLELNTESPKLEEKPFAIVGTDNIRRKWTGTDTAPIGVAEVPSLPEPKAAARPPRS